MSSSGGNFLYSSTENNVATLRVVLTHLHYQILVKTAEATLALLMSRTTSIPIATFGRKNAPQIYKLFDAFEILPINANMKSAMVSQIENIRFVVFIVSLVLFAFSKSRAIWSTSMSRPNTEQMS